VLGMDGRAQPGELATPARTQRKHDPADSRFLPSQVLDAIATMALQPTGRQHGFLYHAPKVVLRILVGRPQLVIS